MAWQAIFSCSILLPIASFNFFPIPHSGQRRASATSGSAFDTTGKLEFENRNSLRKKKPWFGYRVVS
jgi:hypothetical protein